MDDPKRQPTIDVEPQVARWVRNYIRTDRGTDWVREAEALRCLCSGFEWLLYRRVSESGQWTGWFDGIFPATDMLPGQSK